MSVGDKVKILPPFDIAFPGEYTVAEVNAADTWVKLEGEESAFDFRFVEVIDAP